jgi:hypothetical protein
MGEGDTQNNKEGSRVKNSLLTQLQRLQMVPQSSQQSALGAQSKLKLEPEFQGTVRARGSPCSQSMELATLCGSWQAIAQGLREPDPFHAEARPVLQSSQQTRVAVLDPNW